MLKLKKIKKIEPLKERVYNILLESIVESDLSPGEPLTEMTLAKRLGVSKSPIRDALHHLEGDGLVINIPYKGFYVAKLSVKEFNELMDVRMAIEVFCLEQTIESYSDNDIDAFVATMNQASLCREKGRDRSAHEEHLDFHLKIVEKFGNELMLSLYSNNRKKLKRYLRTKVKQFPERLAISYQHHMDILNSFLQRDKASAVINLQHHLFDVRDTFLLQKGLKELSGEAISSIVI